MPLIDANWQKGPTQFPFFCYCFPSKWGKCLVTVLGFLYAINHTFFPRMNLRRIGTFLFCLPVIQSKNIFYIPVSLFSVLVLFNRAQPYQHFLKNYQNGTFEFFWFLGGKTSFEGLWSRRLVFLFIKCPRVCPSHTVILLEWTFKKWGHSNFAFQHC